MLRLLARSTLLTRLGGVVTCRALTTARLRHLPLLAWQPSVLPATTTLQSSLCRALLHTTTSVAAPTMLVRSASPQLSPLGLVGARRNLIKMGTKRFLRSKKLKKHKQGKAGAPPKRRIPKVEKLQHLWPGKRKLKSHHGALKRFYQLEVPKMYKGKLLPKGTFMHKAMGKNHLQAGSSRRRHTARKMAHRPVLTRGFDRRLQKLMPYGTTMQPPAKYVQPFFWEKTEEFVVGKAASKPAPHVLPRDGGFAIAEEAKNSPKAQLLRKAMTGWSYDGPAYDEKGYLLEWTKTTA